VRDSDLSPQQIARAITLASSDAARVSLVYSGEDMRVRLFALQKNDAVEITGTFEAEMCQTPYVSVTPRRRRLTDPVGKALIAKSVVVCYLRIWPSLWQAGHLTNFGSTSAIHERPHSQRILYRRCTATLPTFSWCASIPLAVAPRGGAACTITRRLTGGKTTG